MVAAEQQREKGPATQEANPDHEAALRRLRLAALVFGNSKPWQEHILTLSRVSADAMRAVLTRRGWALVGSRRVGSRRERSPGVATFDVYERNGSLPRAHVPVAEVAVAADRADHVASWCAAVAMRHSVSAAEILAEAMGSDFRGDR